MKILLPVIDPIDVLRLVHDNSSLTDLAEGAQILKLPLHVFQYGLPRALLAVYQKASVLLFLHEEA